ncbi:MAG: DUF1801 domain-containing protein [Flavobacteriaceae bacterium]|nr:DUF1801 domain-containing protein [Flavobacteriaceae bacterium]
MAYEIQTKENDGNVQQFLEVFKDENRYPDLLQILEIMQSVSGCVPKMWGKDIVGFDSYHYKGKSAEGEWFCIGFSPRKQNISLYIISGFEKETELLSRLGKYKNSKSCLYVKRLSDIDVGIFEEFLRKSMEVMKKW